MLSGAQIKILREHRRKSFDSAVDDDDYIRTSPYCDVLQFQLGSRELGRERERASGCERKAAPTFIFIFNSIFIYTVDEKENQRKTQTAKCSGTEMANKQIPKTERSTYMRSSPASNTCQRKTIKMRREKVVCRQQHEDLMILANVKNKSRSLPCAFSTLLFFAICVCIVVISIIQWFLWNLLHNLADNLETKYRIRCTRCAPLSFLVSSLARRSDSFWMVYNAAKLTLLSQRKKSKSQQNSNHMQTVETLSAFLVHVRNICVRLLFRQFCLIFIHCLRFAV